MVTGFHYTVDSGDSGKKLNFGGPRWDSMQPETAFDWFSLAKDMRDNVALGKMAPEAGFLDVIGTKVLRVFHLDIH